MKENRASEVNATFHKGVSKKSLAILLSMTVVVLVFYILKHQFNLDLLSLLHDLFMLKYLPRPSGDVGYGLLFAIGILTSFHCIGMCGGIVMSQTIGKRGEQAGDGGSAPGWIVPSALYNAGRVFSYTLVGGVVGGLGRILSFNGIFKGLVPMLGGLFMIIMGIKLLGIFPALRRFNIPVPSFAAKKLVGKNSYAPFFVGMMTGLMPCGPLQIVQLYALGTRSVAFGALSMFIFAAGTVPGLFAFGALHSFINKKHSDKILKLCAVFVVVLGFVMISRGLALSGVDLPFLQRSYSPADGISKIEGTIQTVTTGIKAGSYPAITVQKGIPVRWTIIAENEDLNECNNAITIPKLNINKKLTAGENIIEFTPEEEGEIIYTCWMGMIKSRITVVSDLSGISAGNKLLSEKQNEKVPLNCNMGIIPGESTECSKFTDPTGKRDCKTETDRTKAEDEERKKAGNQTEDKNQTEVKAESKPAIKTGAHKAEDKPVLRTGAQNEIGAAIGNDKPVEAEEQEWEGYLIDKHCFEIMKPEKETRACLLMEECESSGYGIAVKQRDGSCKFFLFDKKGHGLAYEFLNKTTRNTNFKITIKGRLDGNRIAVTEFNGDYTDD